MSRRDPLAVLLGCLIVLALSSPAGAAPDYPALTGRVVDQANLLDASARDGLAARLAAHAAAGGGPVVVVTPTSLDGDSIAASGVGLGRPRGIGRAGNEQRVPLDSPP